jgi:hypothetical protein
MHRVNNIEVAFSTRVAKLSHLINSNLINKRDELLGQIKSINEKIEEFKTNKDDVERGIRTECGFILERLKTAENKKATYIMHELSETQSELNLIESINAEFDKLTKGVVDQNLGKEPPQPPLEISPIGVAADQEDGGLPSKSKSQPEPPVEATPKDPNSDQVNIADFLLRSSILNKNIEYVLVKPAKKDVDLRPYDLPHEIKDIREALDQHKVLDETLKFQNELIWGLWQEKIGAEDKAIKQLDSEAMSEIKKWNEIA